MKSFLQNYNIDWKGTKDELTSRIEKYITENTNDFSDSEDSDSESDSDYELEIESDSDIELDSDDINSLPTHDPGTPDP